VGYVGGMKRSGHTSVTGLLVSACLLLSACSGSDGGADTGDPGLGGSAGADPSGSGGTGPTSGTAGASGSVTLGGAGSGGGASSKAGGGGSAGSLNAGGSAGKGGSGSGGTAGAGGSGGGFTPPACASASTKLPANAPALTAGVWKNISPPGVPFNTTDGSFTQGMTTDPCNPANLYVSIVGFGAISLPYKGVYRSTDAGSTWSKIGKLETVINLRVDPKNPKHLYAVDGVTGSTNGFWVSNDGGDTWAIPDGFRALAQTDLIFDSYHVEPDPTDFNHILVTFHNPWKAAKYNGNSGIIESTDGGTTWIVHPPINPSWAGGYDAFFLYDPALGIGNKNTWLFGTQGQGYWRTTDAGQTWTKVSDVNMDHGGGTLYYTKEGVLYASGAPKLLKSTDNGATWTQLTPYQFTAFLSVIGDGNLIYAAGHFGGKIMTSKETDGLTWTAYGNDPAEFSTSGPFEMRFDASNGIVYSAHTGAGIWALKVKP